ncbi:MAG: hypothetical protein O7G87_22575, partial [bacterium]|nr:hypothetical protein [bacterium]
MSTSILQWTIHPLTQAPKPKSALLILIILTLNFSVALSFQSLPWGLLTLALLTDAMSRYFLP